MRKTTPKHTVINFLRNSDKNYNLKHNKRKMYIIHTEGQKQDDFVSETMQTERG